MLEFIQTHETEVRLASFAGLLILFSGLEAVFPKKKRVQARLGRWFTNISLSLLSNILLRILFQVTAIGTALFAASKGWGLLNLVLLPFWIELLIALILLDLAIYWQHVLTHKIPVLWRLHKVHHADRDIDASSGVRFHPVEIVLSLLYKMMVILLLGPSAIAVLLFEIILNGSALFNHANIKLPKSVDRVLRLLIVTPDMHRVHHSVLNEETNSNFGFNLSVWDRIFGSYRDQPKLGHDDMTIGLAEYQSVKPSTIVWSLSLPFRPKNR